MEKDPGLGVGRKDMVVLDPFEKTFAIPDFVMVPQNQVFFPVKAANQGSDELPIAGESEIPQNVDLIPLPDRHIPIVYQGFVMGVDVGERAIAIIDDVGMPKMGVGGEINHGPSHQP